MVENQLRELPKIYDIGQKIGDKFTVEAVNKNDFMSVVYSVRHEQQKQTPLACHVIQLPLSQSQKLSLVREQIQSYKDLNFKSFPMSRGMGKEGGVGYIIAQEIEGATLTSHLQKRQQTARPFKTKAICSLMMEVIQALESLKEFPSIPQFHGLLTSNSILIQTNSKPRVKINDLGLFVIRDELCLNSEHNDWVKGSIPELRGQNTPIDPDIYSLGSIFFEMVQLLPFDDQWRSHLPQNYAKDSVVELMIDIISDCVAEVPRKNLSSLKEALKELSIMSGDDDVVTQDLSHLNQQVKNFVAETPLPFQANAMDVLPKEPTAPFPVFKTPYPWDQPNDQIIHPNLNSSTMIGGPGVSAAMEAIGIKAMTPMPDVQPTLPSSQQETDFQNALNYAANQSAQTESPQISTYKTPQPYQSNLIVGESKERLAEKLTAMETFQGVEFMMEKEEDAVFSSSTAIDLGHLSGEAPVMPKIHTPPVSTVNKDPKRAKWLVTKKGIDYGPFNYDEVIKQLFNHEIDVQTEICDSETDDRKSLAEFDDFHGVLAEWNEAKMERDRLKAEAAKRAKMIRQVSMVLGILLVVGMSVTAVFFGQAIYESTLPTPYPMALNTWGQKTKIKPVEALKRLEETTEQKEAREKAIQEARLREQNLQDARDMAKEAREANAEQEVDLDQKGTGRTLSKAEFQRAVSTRSGRLISCIEREVDANPNQKKFVVEVTIQPSGKVLNATLSGGTSNGTKCVFKALQGLTVTPFDGGNYKGKIPFELE